MKNPIPLNIPNIISLYRLLSFPIILWIAFAGEERLFAILLCINLVTDILDGLIARVFKMETAIGAKLDSLADIGTYICAFTGIYLFKSEELLPHIYSFGTLLGLIIFCNIFSLIKFKESASLHLYSTKIGGYIQGTFFFVLFLFNFYTPFYYFMVIWGILSFIEHFIVQLKLKEMKSNSKGLYWVMKA